MNRKINRRDFLKAVGVSAAGLAYGCTQNAGTKPLLPKGVKRPNLIYVFADQLRYQSLGYAGDKKAKTPNIDKLASEGFSFCNAVSNTPICAPYRATLFTGKYASSTGMVINELRVNPNHRCFGHVITDAGYETGYIGKWHLWGNSLNVIDDDYQYIPPGRYRLGFDGFWAANNFNHFYYKAFYYKDERKKISYEKGIYEPDAQTDMAVEFINEKAKSEKPFTLFLSYGPPHDPWVKNNVPKQFYQMFKDVNFELPANWRDEPDKYGDRNTEADAWPRFWKEKLPEFTRIYYAMTASLDWNFGRILDAIDKAGIRNDTIVVFTSDHGEMLGANGRVFKNIFYDESIRVPFLIRWPARIKPGTLSNACFSSVDIMPTLLGLMGLKAPNNVEGMDLSHCALCENGPEPEAAFLQGMGHSYHWQDEYEWRAMRDKRYTYAVYRVDGSELLFDNIQDPFQMQNLADKPEHKALKEKFREMLEKKMSELNDTFEKCTWYRDNWIKDRIVLRSATLKG